MPIPSILWYVYPHLVVSSAKNMLIVGKYTIQECCGIGKGWICSLQSENWLQGKIPFFLGPSGQMGC